jgi:hypothetical protein
MARVATGLVSAVILAQLTPALAGPGAKAVSSGIAARPANLTLADAPPALRAAVLRTLRSRPGGIDTPSQVAGPFDDFLGAAVALSGATAVVGASGVNNFAGAVYVYVRSGTRWALKSVLSDPRNFPSDEFGVSVAVTGTTLLVGANGTNKAAGAAYLFGRSGTRWHLERKFADPRGVAADFFGASVALAGPSVLIGAPGVKSGAGAAYAYLDSGTRWRSQVLSNPQAKRSFYGISVAISGVTAVIGAWGVDNEAGAAYIYGRSKTQWQFKATLDDPGHMAHDSFGTSVAASGMTVLIGAPGAGGNSGAAYIYVREGTNWAPQASFMDPDSPQADVFGAAVALSGSTAVIGGFQSHVNAGSAYLYGRSGSHWKREAALADPNHTSDDDFGLVVALSGTTSLIGAQEENVSGAVFVYMQRSTRWSRQAALTDPRGDPGNARGASVAISGSTAVVGAWGANHLAGAAYIYIRTAGRWRLQATLTDPSGSSGDIFGSSVAVSGSTVLVGAWGTGDTGAVYVYVKSGRTWHRQATLGGTLFFLLTQFGSSLAISGSTAIIGAWGAQGGAGLVYVYVRSGTKWKLQTMLSDPDGKPLDGFGEAVALWGKTVLVSATGVHDYAGAVYVYTRSGSHWRRHASLPDPHGAPNDQFGTSVALSGAQAVIGAPGVAAFSGAVYMYDQSGARWRQQVVVTVSRRVSPAGGFGGAVALSGTGRRAIALLSGQSVSGLTTERYQCGSAFEYTRPNGHWRERARVADPRCRSYDEFGYALSISGATALIGAPGAGKNAGVTYLLTLLNPGK